MIVATSQITKGGHLTAEQHYFDGSTFIQLKLRGELVAILDTDEAFNLKHLLDKALHGKKYSWQVEGEKE